MIREALEDGRDYGTIPGAGTKKVLLKPGAERLCLAYGFTPEFEVIESDSDREAVTPYTVTKWETVAKPGNADELKAEGLGRFKKDPKNGKWLWQERVDESGVSSGFYRYVIRCILKRGDQVFGQGVGSCSSLESKYVRQPHDSENTILKMAKKRAHVDAVLNTLALSDRFTQDMEDRIPDADKPAEVVDAEIVEDAPAQPVQPVPADQATADLWAAQALMKERGWDNNSNAADFKLFREACKGAGKVWTRAMLEAAAEGAQTLKDCYYVVVGVPVKANPEQPATTA